MNPTTIKSNQEADLKEKVVVTGKHTQEKWQPGYFSKKTCPVCGNLMLVPTGTCHVCQVCGTSDGCS